LTIPRVYDAGAIIKDFNPRVYDAGVIIKDFNPRVYDAGVIIKDFNPRVYDAGVIIKDYNPRVYECIGTRFRDPPESETRGIVMSLILSIIPRIFYLLDFFYNTKGLI
jgi:hypothetical protein